MEQISWPAYMIKAPAHDEADAFKDIAVSEDYTMSAAMSARMA